MNIVGWKERIDFPDWGLSGVKAKMDTGARTAALGVLSLDIVDGVVSLIFAPYRRRPDRIIKAKVPLVGFADVKSSAGKRERRPIIETPIRLGNELWTVRFTLADRQSMLIPVLLGRTTLANRFVVDPDRKYCQRHART